MSCPKYLIALHVVTAGLQDEDLGSDEEEIVQMSWTTIDTTTSKIIDRNDHFVKPKNKDVNDNILSQAGRDAYCAMPDDKLNGSLPLAEVLDRLNVYIETQLAEDVCLITDGQLPLRQVLHPEAFKKSILLSKYFFQFYDLRKEFAKFYGNLDVKNMEEMLACTINTSTCNQVGDEDDKSVQAKSALENMVVLILRLLEDGHKFEDCEKINGKLEPGICTKNEYVDSNTVVRARGLPWQSTDQDIANFFKGLDIGKGGVALCLSVQGRRNGEALIRFVNQEQRDMALRRHKHHIGQRYIEVYKASGEDFVNVAGGNNNEAQMFLSQGGRVILRMRGLPYDSTARHVIDFFASNEPCPVMNDENGVLFVRKLDGRATGDAFVMFETEEIACKAQQKHRESIGSRYIELFRSTTAEVQQVFNRNMDFRCYENSVAQVPIPPLIATQPLLPSLTRRDCVRLRGLPYEAQVEQILDFLNEHSKNIVFQGVHMVYNAQGQPSGEAFIQMDSEQSALLAAQQRHHHYMVFGKKQRYIEVFQCSVEDMNLTSGISNLQRPLLPSNAPFLPPFAANFPFAHLRSAASSVPQPPGLPMNDRSSVASLPASHQAHAVPTARVPAQLNGSFNQNPFNMIYWPYPSPPVSPTTYFATHQNATPSMVNMRTMR